MDPSYFIPIFIFTTIVLLLGIYGYFEHRGIERGKQAERERNTARDQAERERIAGRERYLKELDRLTQSDNYQFIQRFVKSRDWDNGDIDYEYENEAFARLEAALAKRGWRFTSEEIYEILSLEATYQKKQEAKERILVQDPKDEREVIQAFLNIHPFSDTEMLVVLGEILQSKELGSSFRNNLASLAKEVARVKDELEQEHFEKRLLAMETPRLSMKEIDQLNGYEFESFLVDLFSRIGYSVEQTKSSGDQGADVVAIKFGEKTVIQAKRLGGKVGNYAVQEVMAAISIYRAQKGMVVTNSYFTPAAKELALANNIELIDRDGLSELLRKYW